LVLILFFAVGLARSQGTGTSAANFLKIGVGARASGMGEAFVAIADDATGAYWNSAGLANLNQSQITFMHNEWLSDLRYEYLSYAIPHKSKGTFAFSFSYLSLGKFEGYDLTGNATQDFSAHDLAGTFAYGHKLTPQFAVGGAFKYIQQKIDDQKASAYAVDFGALYQINAFNLGLSVRNIGTKMKFIQEEYALPLTVDLGLAFRGLANLTLAGDIEIPRDNSVLLKQGIEYGYQEMFFLRMGYGYSTSGEDFGGSTGLALGAGFLLKQYSFDYTYSPHADLGDAHRISFTLNFGPPRGFQDF
jgi:long-subunit fatty acid transport protein